MTLSQLKADVDAKFALFNTAMATYQARLEEANKAIQNKLKSFSDEAQNTADGASAIAADAQAKANISKSITDKFATTIDGGLINTVTVELREADTQNVTAGHSGIQGSLKNLPAYWAGGTYAEAIAGTAKAIIRHDGSSKFSDTEITGVINALSGEIGNLSIQDGELKSSYSTSKAIWDYSKFPAEYVGERTVSGEVTVSVDAVELNEAFNYQGIPNTTNTRITPDRVSVKSTKGLFIETKSELVGGRLSIEVSNTQTGVTSKVEIFSDGIYFDGQKFTGGGGGYTHPSTHPASMITAGTFPGIVKANNNTSYTTKQVRNMILSTGNAVASSMANGDIWIKYE